MNATTIKRINNFEFFRGWVKNDIIKICTIPDISTREQISNFEIALDGIMNEVEAPKFNPRSKKMNKED